MQTLQFCFSIAIFINRVIRGLEDIKVFSLRN